MKYFVAVAFLAATASAVSLDFQPSAYAGHPSIPSDGPESRIVGGNEVPAHQAPYQAALFLKDAFCGGSLINERYVLTSAQCASLSSRPVVILGAHRLKEKENEQQSFVAQKIIFHPHWDSKFVNDVALIMLPQNVRFTDAIRPMRLAPPDAGSFENEQVRVTGWGKTSDNSNDLSPVLRYLLNPITKNRVCEQQFNIRLTNGQMCLSGEGNRAPCLGDGGAPVVGVYQKELTQVGIVSYLYSPCEKGLPVVLTRVSYYYNWIVASM